MPVCREFSWDLVEIFSEAIVRPYALRVSMHLYYTPCGMQCLQLYLHNTYPYHCCLLAVASALLQYAWL